MRKKGKKEKATNKTHLLKHLPYTPPFPFNSRHSNLNTIKSSCQTVIDPSLPIDAHRSEEICDQIFWDNARYFVY